MSTSVWAFRGVIGRASYDEVDTFRLKRFLSDRPLPLESRFGDKIAWIYTLGGGLGALKGLT